MKRAIALIIRFSNNILKAKYITYPTPQPGSYGTIAIEVLLDDKVIYTADWRKRKHAILQSARIVGIQQPLGIRKCICDSKL